MKSMPNMNNYNIGLNILNSLVLHDLNINIGTHQCFALRLWGISLILFFFMFFVITLDSFKEILQQSNYYSRSNNDTNIIRYALMST